MGVFGDVSIDVATTRVNQHNDRVISGLSLPILVAIFAAGVGAIWVAGIQLSKSVDIIDNHLGLGEALGGLILLAVVTNLPEIAIVSTAAVRHNFDIATGNVLGGIAIQTVVLVALDGFGVPRRPLTNATSLLSQVLEGALVMAVLAVAIMATILPQGGGRCPYRPEHSTDRSEVELLAVYRAAL